MVEQFTQEAENMMRNCMFHQRNNLIIGTYISGFFALFLAGLTIKNLIYPPDGESTKCMTAAEIKQHNDKNKDNPITDDNKGHSNKKGILNDQSCPKFRGGNFGAPGRGFTQEYITIKTGKKTYGPALLLAVLTMITIIGGIVSYSNRNNEQFLVNKCLNRNMGYGPQWSPPSVARTFPRSNDGVPWYA